MIVEGDDWMRIEYASVDRLVEVAAFEWYRVYDPPAESSGTTGGSISGTIMVIDPGFGVIDFGRLLIPSCQIGTFEAVDPLMAEEGSEE